MQLDEGAEERETDAQAALRSRDRLVTLDEQVEDARQQIRLDAAPVVADANDRFAANAPELEPHVSAFR